MDKRWAYLLSPFLIGIAAPAELVHAHIKLIKPASWVVEDFLGNPQKAGPCGPAQGAAAMMTGMVTNYHVGDEISVEWSETIPHPGHFRIALVEDRALLKDPELPLKDAATSCDYDETKLPVAAGNVLADGVSFRPVSGPADASGKQFSAKVKLPDKPCEKCTLQLIQWMESHAPPCVYYHCADIRILPAGAPEPPPAAPPAGAAGMAAPVVTPVTTVPPTATAAGSGATGTMAAAVATAGTKAPATARAGTSPAPAAPASTSSGCSIASPGAHDRGELVFVAGLAVTSIAFARRRRRLQA